MLFAPSIAFVRNFTDAHGTPYFTFYDYYSGQAVWKSDGTPEGTVPIEVGPNATNPTNLTVVRNRLFFAASDTASGNELWALDLPPADPLGDLNCDGVFNGADIDPFFFALGEPPAYAARFPNCDPLLGDMNNDGRFNGGDIDLFFQCLGGGGCP